MNIFKSNTEKHRDHLDEEFLFGAAAQEIANGDISQGLYAKALSECGGDEKIANSRYIKLRVAMMKSERSAITEREQIAQLEQLKQLKQLQQLQQLQQYNEVIQHSTEKKLNPVMRVLAVFLGLLMVSLPLYAPKFNFVILMAVPFGAWLIFCGLTGKGE